MKIRQVISEAWGDLTGRQQIVIAIVALAGTALLLSGWINAATSWVKMHQLEHEKIAAERDASTALDKAKEIAQQIRAKEAELAQTEQKRDEKQLEVNNARGDVDRDRANYDRARQQRTVGTPSADELCEQLAALGHPCEQ